MMLIRLGGPYVPVAQDSRAEALRTPGDTPTPWVDGALALRRAPLRRPRVVERVEAVGLVD